MLNRFISSVTLCCTCLLTSAILSADDRVDYLTEIKPLLRERCFGCHGALKQEADLRLDTVGLMIVGGDSGAAVLPGKVSESILFDRITATDIDVRMPPEHDGEPFSAAQIALLRKWIEQDAPAPPGEKPEADPQDHWAFQPIVRPAVPKVGNINWVKNPIDAFLAQQHETQGLTPQSEATRNLQLRRLYLDLIGIPPTVDEVAAFVDDLSPDRYESEVERLLEDQRHGERWARHWMDVWRYSDWWGFKQVLRNSQKHMWHWRDWIVESLNADTPYDEMIRLMLAADELHPTDLEKLRATGYLARNYFLFNRNQWMDETVEHVSKALFGLTMNCAKCHDHKYDPIAQADYYRLRAFFEPYHVRLNVVPGEADLARDGIPNVFDGLPDEPTYLLVRGEASKPDKSTILAPGVPEIIAFKELTIKPIELPSAAWQPERQPWVIESHLASMNKKCEAAEVAVVVAREKLVAVKKEEADVLGEKIEVNDVDSRLDEKPHDSGTTPSPEDARSAVIDAQAALHVAHAAIIAAIAEVARVELCAEAMRAEWTDASAKNSQEIAVAALRAERQSLVSKAKCDVAVAQLALLRAARDKKPPAPAKKALKLACEAVEKAVVDAGAEIKPTDRYTPFPGAKWTPTRFLDSTTDDPKVEFSPVSTGRRAALADWITDRRNPLTARVAANHIWLRHMGAPLVSTLFDFGRNGTPPTHPELLDWLAIELIDSGWSMKHLHRVIVNSNAYRMGSSVVGGETNVAKDAENRYWWRRKPIRLESQVVRDSILSNAGTLDLTMGGPPVPANQQDKSKRRSLYFFHSNNHRNLFLTMFDEALVKECYRREQSIVPQQALALTNSKLVLDASEEIANRLSASNRDDLAFIQAAFSSLLGMDAGEAEIAASLNAIEDWRQMPGESARNARSNFVWVLVNHNDFVTLR